MKILIRNVKMLDMLGDVPNCTETSILIEENRIKKIKAQIEEVADEIIDGKGLLAMPGLVNTHTHVGMSIFRGYQDERKLMDWLQNAIFPKEDKLSAEDIYWASKLSIIEMIKSGTTTFNDMYFETHKTLQAVEETGIRAQLSWSVTDDSIRNKYEETIKYHNKYKTEDSRIKIAVAPHAPYTCNPNTIKSSLELAKELNISLHIHLAETKDELKTIKERYNKTPTEYLNDLGVFEVPVIQIGRASCRERV